MCHFIFAYFTVHAFPVCIPLLHMQYCMDIYGMLNYIWSCMKCTPHHISIQSVVFEIIVKLDT